MPWQCCTIVLWEKRRCERICLSFWMHYYGSLKNAWFGIQCNVEGFVESADLSYRTIVSRIPKEIGLLYNLLALKAAKNQLFGTIPTELGLLTQLTRLSLGRNKLTGSIPSELGLLTQLTRLSLYQNRLTGIVPSELNQLVGNLETVLLECNDLRGDLDSVFYDSTDSFKFIGASDYVFRSDCYLLCSCCTYCCDCAEDNECV
jgi:hypothetical protein